VALLLDLQAQPGGHVAVAFVDQGQKQVLALLGKLGEGGLQDVPLLESLHLIFIHILFGEQAGHQAGKQIDALPPGHIAGHPFQGDTYLTVNQQHWAVILPGVVHRLTLLRSRFDTKLLS